MTELDHNPWLSAGSERKGSAQTIEVPSERRLVCWQTRRQPPTQYEIRLATALQNIFGDEVYDIESIVARLNGSDVRSPDGEAWSEANFRAAMCELGRLF